MIRPSPKTPSCSSTFARRSSIPGDPQANLSIPRVITESSDTGCEYPHSQTEEKSRASCFRWINPSTANSAQRLGNKGALSWVIGVIFWRIGFLVSSKPFGLVTTTPCGPFPMIPTNGESGAAQGIMGLVGLNGLQWHSVAWKRLQIPWVLRMRCPMCWTYGSSAKHFLTVSVWEPAIRFCSDILFIILYYIITTRSCCIIFYTTTCMKIPKAY